LTQNPQNIESLQSEIASLKVQLEDANSIIDAIREGEVDALVLQKDGQPQIYSIESADYTYRVLIEKFGEGALSISEDGLILYCNDYFSKLIGVAASKITGNYLQSYMDYPAELQALQTALVSGTSKGEAVFNGANRKIYAYISLTDLHPNVPAIGVVITDLTEKIKHEEALVQYQNKLEIKVNELHLTNANLEQFIHVVSHDIKEPLRKILAYTAHLGNARTELFTDGEIKNLNVINASALRLNSLVDDLVKYAFSATVDQNNAPIELRKVVQEVTDDLEITIAEYKAEIKAGQLPIINASKVQMRQLFANLISNAIKYSRENVSPTITITSEIVPNEDRVSEIREWHKITLKDNGIGMEPSHLNKIFTIFQRLHLRNEYSGNGIGLAICKKIMENHHGKIEVESAINEGSTFSLYFPITK
jgi:PAS domain S-box-containing protein